MRRSAATPRARKARTPKRPAFAPVKRKWTRTAPLDGPLPLSSADILGLPGLVVENVTRNDGAHGGGRIVGRLVPPATCPGCGQRLRSKGPINTPLIIRHTPVLGGQTELEIWRGRSECTACKKSITPRPEWIHPTRQMTWALVEQILVDSLRDKHLPFSEQARRAGVNRRQVGEIRDHVVRQVPQIPHFQPEVLLIDDTHPIGYPLGEGATAIMAHRTKPGEPHQLLMVADGKDEASMVAALQAIAQWPKVGEGVRWVVCDGDPNIIRAVRKVFPEATRVSELWHHARDFTLGMDRVRKDLQKRLDSKTRRALKRDARLFTKLGKDLNPREQARLLGWLNAYPELRMAYGFSQAILALSALGGRRDAIGWFLQIIAGIPDEVRYAFETAIRRVRDHASAVANYFLRRVTNGPLENCNRLIKHLSRRGPSVTLATLEAMALAIRGPLTEDRILDLLRNPIPAERPAARPAAPFLCARKLRKPDDVSVMAPLPSAAMVIGSARPVPIASHLPLLDFMKDPVAAPSAIQAVAPPEPRRSPPSPFGPLFDVAGRLAEAAPEAGTSAYEGLAAAGRRLGYLGEPRGFTGSEGNGNRDSRYLGQGLSGYEEGVNPHPAPTCPSRGPDGASGRLVQVIAQPSPPDGPPTDARAPGSVVPCRGAGVPCAP